MAHIRGNEPIQTPTAQTADQSQIIKAGAIFLGGRYGGGKEPIHPQLEERQVTRRSPQRIPVGAPE